MAHAAEAFALPHSAIFEIAGIGCEVQTSDALALSAIDQSFARSTESLPAEFSLRVHIYGTSSSLQPTHFRGAAHLVFTRYGENILLFDIAHRCISAWLTSAVARDPNVWAQKFAPLMLGVFGCAIGVLPMHCACLVRDGKGYLIAGESMSGKSTLALALAQEGFELLSDDWTFMRKNGDALLACGLHAPVKLLPDAISHFPELREFAPVETANGEIAYEVEPSKLRGICPVSSCTPECVFFLERSGTDPAELTSEPPQSVHQYVENSVERLPTELRAASEIRQALIGQLGRLPSWHFRYGGPPKEGALFLSRFVEQLQGVSP